MNGPEHFDGDDEPAGKSEVIQILVGKDWVTVPARPDPKRFGAVLPPEPSVLKRATDALGARLADDSPWALVKELERELRQRLAELQALKAPRLVSPERLEALEALATATRRFIACQVEFPDAPDACTEKFDALLQADEELDRYPT